MQKAHMSPTRVRSGAPCADRYDGVSDVPEYPGPAAPARSLSRDSLCARRSRHRLSARSSSQATPCRRLPNDVWRGISCAALKWAQHLVYGWRQNQPVGPSSTKNHRIPLIGMSPHGIKITRRDDLGPQGPNKKNKAGFYRQIASSGRQNEPRAPEQSPRHAQRWPPRRGTRQTAG
jgi:hypothetical protein